MQKKIKEKKLATDLEGIYVAVGSHVVMVTYDIGQRDAVVKSGRYFTEQRLDLLHAPNAEGAFLLGRRVAVWVRIGVFGAVKASTGIAEAVLGVCDDISDDLGQPVLARHQVSLYVRRNQLGLVVKHLFKVRYVPLLVGGIPGESLKKKTIIRLKCTQPFDYVAGIKLDSSSLISFCFI